MSTWITCPVCSMNVQVHGYGQVIDHHDSPVENRCIASGTYFPLWDPALNDRQCNCGAEHAHMTFVSHSIACPANPIYHKGE